MFRNLINSCVKAKEKKFDFDWKAKNKESMKMDSQW